VVVLPLGAAVGIEIKSEGWKDGRKEGKHP